MDGNGEHGVQHKKVTIVTIAFDHDTGAVSLGAKDVRADLLGMMLHEAAVQVETLRRQAAAFEFRAQMLEQQKNEAIADAVRRGGGRA